MTPDHCCHACDCECDGTDIECGGSSCEDECDRDCGCPERN